MNVGVGGKVEDVKVEGSGGVSYTRDEIARSQTYQFTLDGKVAAHVGVDGASTEGSLNVAVVADTGSDASVQKIVVSGAYSDSVTRGTDTNSVSSGAGGSYSIEIPADAGNQQVLASLLHDIASGNTTGASASLGVLSRNATIITQTDISSAAATGVNGGDI